MCRHIFSEEGLSERRRKELQGEEEKQAAGAECAQGNSNGTRVDGGDGPRQVWRLERPAGSRAPSGPFLRAGGPSHGQICLVEQWSSHFRPWIHPVGLRWGFPGDSQAGELQGGTSCAGEEAT